MNILVMVGVVCLTTATVYSAFAPLSDEFIQLINTKQDSWQAGRNFPQDTPLEHIRKLAGALLDTFIKELEVIKHSESLRNTVPEHFDARDKWPHCPTLNEIRDQGSCGSCWAVAAVEAMSDRFCIYSNGTRNVHISAEDLLSCCRGCSLECYGGQISRAWDYWKNSGIVSGGAYNSSQGCKPYEIPPCEHSNITSTRKHCNGTPRVPQCSKTCIPQYHLPYDTDKVYGRRIYTILNDEEHIKAEIFKHGPVEASLQVYEDFISYKSGVYRHTIGNRTGGHAIKIIGWGVENNDKYWLIANSWNTDWGDNGFFKIIRGEDHCGIESSVVAGEPKLD